jgi:hypothetical protein
MTAVEMQVAFQREVNQLENAPKFNTQDVLYWLNEAVVKFVDGKYKEFEETQNRTESLKTLVEEDIFATYSGSYGNANKENCYTADIFSPDEHRYVLSEEVDIIYTDYSDVEITKRQGVTECSQESYLQALNNPFSEHILHYGEAKPLRLYIQNYVELITDGNYSVTNYILRYLRNPAKINLLGTVQVDCDLPVFTHDYIVKIAVSMVLENMADPRYQSHKIENTET